MGRSPCCANEGLNRGAWSAKEDQILINYIKTQGEGKWRSIPLKAGLKRCGKSCRLRWLNYLKPGIKRGNISADEEDLIIRLHKLLGNRWSLIAGRLPGRTDNEIKNYWNTNLSKRIGGQPLSEPSKRNLAKGNHAKLPTQTTPTPPMVAIRTKARRLSNLNPPFPNTDMDMKSVPQSPLQPLNAELHDENDRDEGRDRYIDRDCDLDLDWLKCGYDDVQACGDGATGEYHFTDELCSSQECNLDFHGETTLDWLSKQLLEDHNMMNIDLSSLDSFLDHEECPNEDSHPVKV